MTSANVTYYQVFKDGEKVAEYRQNCLCKDSKTEGLKSHVPAEDFTLVLCWPDEYEVPHYTQEMSLADYWNGVKPVWLDENGNPEVDYEEFVELQKMVNKSKIILKHDDNLIGFAHSEEEARAYVKREWGYSEEQIEEDMSDGILSFKEVKKLEFTQ
jgi:hypothetical protein